MKLIPSALTLVIVLAVSLVSAPTVGAVQSEKYGLPAKLRSLSDLQPTVDRKDITPAEKTEVLVSWLKQERDHPRPTLSGLGGPISSGYVQAQILRCFFLCGDPLTADRLASDVHTDTGVREALAIGLGIMGDRRQVPKLIRILKSHRTPDYRQLAAAALGDLGATEAIPALQGALEDGYSVKRLEGVGPLDELRYPVREDAKGSLARLRDPNYLAEARKRCGDFAKRLEDEEKQAAEGKAPGTGTAEPAR
jgi:hypothetical protein